MARIAEMGLIFVLAMTCITIGPHLSVAQVAPAPALDCTSALVPLVPCLSFLTNSSVTTVVPTCCSGLSNVSTSAPQCLCQLISPSASNQSAQLGINDTRALELPGLCGLTLNVASCAAALAPASAPVPVAFVPVSAPAPVTPGPVTPAPAISPASSLAPGPAPGAVSPSPNAASPSPATTPVSSPTSTEAPAPSGDCSAVTTELVPCVDFLNDTAASPSATCCTNLGEAVTSSKQCVCQIVQSPSLGAANTTRVMELPSLCSLSVSLSDCSSVIESPTAGPGESPSGNDGRPAAATSLFMVIGLCLGTFAHAVL